VTHGTRDEVPVLCTRLDERLCALPLILVTEIMRPLPLEPGSGAPGLLGWTVVRGRRTPVLDLAALAGGPVSLQATRFISVHDGEQRASLAVDGVLGVRRVDAAVLEGLPRLLSSDPAHDDPALSGLLGRLRDGARVAPPEVLS
jgi:purine-binding chemotaxis protein CheW